MRPAVLWVASLTAAFIVGLTFERLVLLRTSTTEIDLDPRRPQDDASSSEPARLHTFREKNSYSHGVNIEAAEREAEDGTNDDVEVGEYSSFQEGGDGARTSPWKKDGVRGGSTSSSSAAITTDGDDVDDDASSAEVVVADRQETQHDDAEGSGPPAEASASSSAVVAAASLRGGVVENARSVYAEISEEILARWGPKYEETPLFSGGMRFSDGGRVIENKMLNAVLEQGSFVAAFTGISTTAGHDCLYEESYPIVLNRTMGRLMAATGVRFEAINVAMGNTRPLPYSYCVDAHAGTEADIIAWDMSMMVPNRKCGPAATAIEMFIRSATVLPRHPAVLVMDASPLQETCDNGRLPWTIQRNKNFVGECEEERNLMRVYREFGLHQIAPSDLVPSVTCGDDLFARDTLFNATEKNYPYPSSWHPGPSGHLLLADMLFMHYAKVFLSALARLEDVTPVGVTAAQLREQDAPSRTTLGVSLGLVRVGDVTREEVLDNAFDVNKVSGGYMGGGRGRILPPPAWCADWRFCKGAGSYRCANTFFPLAGKEGSRLVDMVSERTPVVLNGNHSAGLSVRPTDGHWAVTLNEIAPNFLAYQNEPPPEGMHHPIDEKWVLVGDLNSGPIEFEFETIGVPPGRGRSEVEEEEEEEDKKTETGQGATGAETFDNSTTAMERGNFALEDSRVTVCRPDFIDRIVFTDAKGVRFYVDGVEVLVTKLDHYGLKEDSCVLLEAEVGVGRHTLTVEPLASGDPYVAISHVLYPA